jgi:replicative superfamily II helicase
MLCILNVLKQYKITLETSGEDDFDRSQFKIVYIAPMKALVQEVVQSFTLRLTESLGENYTRNGWERCKTALEMGGKDVFKIPQ